MGGRAFDGEVTTLLWRSKLDGLPTIASLEGSCGSRGGAVEVGLVTNVVVLVGLLQLELLQLSLSLSPNHSFLRTDNIKHDDYVLSLLQPATWHVECLLRTN